MPAATCVPRRVTTGPPAALRLTSHTGPQGWRADAADLALVDVEVVDANGRRVPTALDMVRFSLDGPAEWRGGIAQGDSSGKGRNATPAAAATVNIVTQAPPPPDGVTAYPGAAREDDNYILSRNLPVEAGINRVALRSTLAPGRVTVTARADGLAPASLS